MESDVTPVISLMQLAVGFNVLLLLGALIVKFINYRQDKDRS